MTHEYERGAVNDRVAELEQKRHNRNEGECCGLGCLFLILGGPVIVAGVMLLIAR